MIIHLVASTRALARARDRNQLLRNAPISKPDAGHLQNIENAAFVCLSEAFGRQRWSRKPDGLCNCVERLYRLGGQGLCHLSLQVLMSFNAGGSNLGANLVAQLSVILHVLASYQVTFNCEVQCRH